MKWLLIALLLVPGLCFADVTAEIISHDIDTNGNIRVYSQYKIDGVEVESPYPKIDGKSVYATRYSKQNFLNMTDKEIEDRILSDLEAHSENLVQKEFDKKAVKSVKDILVGYNKASNEAFIAEKLQSLIGKDVLVKDTSIRIDSDNDNKLDKKITLKTNGDKIEEDTIPPISQ